jgi:hypothetical protein
MIARDELEYVRSWFNYPGQPHVATLHPSGWLIWERPGTSIYHVNYNCWGRNLIVVGDIGDAVFSWSQRVTFEWLAGLDFDYFWRKCQASETGRTYYQWNSEVIGAQAEKILRDEGTARWDDARAEGIEDAIHDEQEWYAWCHANRELLGDDLGEWVGNGRVPNIRAVGMFEGLKMAVAQLSKAAA